MTVRVYRIAVGSVVLLLVDLIWVASSELTEYLYRDRGFNKPFFTSYAKSSMFTIYLLGFVLCQSWRTQCSQLVRGLRRVTNESNTDSMLTAPPTASSTSTSSQLYSVLDMHDESSEELANNSTNELCAFEGILGESVWVPIKFSDNYGDIASEKSSGTESDGDRGYSRKKSANRGAANGHKTVRFSKLTEVRQLSDLNADEALLARMSYQATLRAQESVYSSGERAANKLTVMETIKLSLSFCMLWFAGNFSYQISLKYSEAAVVNVLSSTSSLFTIVLGSLFPSTSTSDRFSLTKLIAVMISIGCVATISTAESRVDSVNYIPIGAFWALSGAFFYAAYIVLLRHEVNSEDSIDIPMFFGFVGLFSLILLWPAFFILHYSQLELFQWPNVEQWCLILVNGLIGTVLSELLWLWGCFLTSSLLASLSITLTIPLSVMFDVLLKGVNYPRLFLIGTVPLFVSFIGITILSHYDNWDPIASMLLKLVRHSVLRRPMVRVRDALYSEQTQALINENA